MLQEISLQGLTTAQLEQLHTHLACEFFSDICEAKRDEISVQIDTVKNCLPASFVLASLFDVEAMTSDIPEHVYESDPSLEWVTCPCCDGEKWLETNGNGWTSTLFSDHRLAYAHRHLNSSYKVCGRCNGSGEVLDLATPHAHTHSLGRDKTPKTPETPETPTVDVLIARLEYLLSKRRVVKMTAQNPRSTPVNSEQWQSAA